MVLSFSISRHWFLPFSASMCYMKKHYPLQAHLFLLTCLWHKSLSDAGQDWAEQSLWLISTFSFGHHKICMFVRDNFKYLGLWYSTIDLVHHNQSKRSLRNTLRYVLEELQLIKLAMYAKSCFWEILYFEKYLS